MVMIMIGKFAISPLIIFCAFKILGLIWPAAAVTGLPLSVFILTASLPCHAQTAIMCEYYDLESEYATNLVSLSTLISLFTIPIYATILLH
jgi:predicted permease